MSIILSCPANAAPEWQAGSLRWRSRELVAACPLEGLVRRLNKEYEQPSASIASSCLALCPDRSHSSRCHLQFALSHRIHEHEFPSLEAYLLSTELQELTPIHQNHNPSIHQDLVADLEDVRIAIVKLIMKGL